ncbi:MAG: hypothetical protein AAF206_16925 [Bacteroidota bacterium]
MLSEKAKIGQKWAWGFFRLQLSMFLIGLAVGSVSLITTLIWAIWLPGSFLFAKGYKWTERIINGVLALMMFGGVFGLIQAFNWRNLIFLAFLGLSLVISMLIPAVHVYLEEMSHKRKHGVGLAEKIDEIGKRNI